MIDIDDVIIEISNRTGIERETVNKVCRYTFLYTIDKMKDLDDTKDILFNSMFKFKLKRRYKENKNNIYTAR